MAKHNRKDRLDRKEYNKQENRHHLVSQCMKDQYNVGMEENILKMLKYKHDCLHALFGCLHTPKDQLKEMYNIYEPVLSETAKQLFQTLLNVSEYDFYIEWLKRWKKKNTKQNAKI